jgi:hypothetical protein
VAKRHGADDEVRKLSGLPIVEEGKMRAIARWSYVPIIGSAGWVLTAEFGWIGVVLAALFVMVGDYIAEYAFTGSINGMLSRRRTDKPNDA